jgi:hypothetical protein
MKGHGSDIFVMVPILAYVVQLCYPDQYLTVFVGTNVQRK